ncbi:DUF2779 domain-containing protein [Polynucleobacter ibericus]|uniref:DUF2779 domain-containing protein n=1 Tax=Polynucleobacter ibericus TaxID=1819725 RepID=UPI00203D7CEC|nr:DUF2779 domain-containing protein [Polynucleobacter ibericus]QWE07899.1 DUF2779 domain-containing protein [Polynucleobacter ibericus]
MSKLTKSKILLNRQCPRRLWLQVNRPELAIEDESSMARFRDGNAVGDIARKIHPGGIFIETLNKDKALSQTAEALQGATVPIFEAAFIADDVLVRVDLLLPDAKGYRLVEVKSSTSMKEYHLEDVKVQSWVMSRAGMTPTRVALAHINSSFVYPGYANYQGLFSEVDLTEEVAVPDEVNEWVESAKATLSLKDEPDTKPGSQCSSPFECSFQEHCAPQEMDVEYPVSILPYGKALASKLKSEGYKDLREVPAERFENPKHIRVHRSSLSGLPELDDEATQLVQALAYPRYYLDFETIAFAVPVWANTSPYTQLPFQWSCHVEDAQGNITHQEFLDTTGSDPRRAFAESLVNVLGEGGPIVVYNAPFEGARMKELATYFPDLSTALLAAVDRLFDLLPIARNHYYHPDMKGSWSIKAVLPTIAPELNYSNLLVGNGGMAQDAYREIIDTKTGDEKRKQMHEGLLKYCEQDTLAMIKITHAFSGVKN